MKKVFLISLILVGFINFTEAQSTEVNQNPFCKISLKLNYSNVTSKQLVPIYGNQPITIEERFYKKNAYYGIEGLYRFNNLWSAGLYFGYARGTFISNEILSSGTNSYSFAMDRLGKAYFYGINGELQLLPLLIKENALRFSLYCPIQLGLVSQQITTFNTNSRTWDKPALEIGAGLGLGYNFTKNFGVFGEYTLGHFYNERNSLWKVGLVLSL